MHKHKKNKKCSSKKLPFFINMWYNLDIVLLQLSSKGGGCTLSYISGGYIMAKEMIAMLLAGGQGSRLYALTQKLAKPAVPFGGKYRIIDFPLSNCTNSNIDIVGVLTQYESVLLGTYVGAGSKWGLDGSSSLAAILPARERGEVGATWYAGTADAIYQNISFLDQYDPEYVLILSGDHIYKMDYEVMLDFHKSNKADITIATLPVPMEEASRFGVVITDETKRILEFEEKPPKPRSNLASMGIYIFTWKVLRQALIDLSDQPGCDFGKHIIPYCHENGKRVFAYEYNGYWKDVGTLQSYWESNMELIDIVPEFNLYEEFWKIYTKSDAVPPLYVSEDGFIERSIVCGNSTIEGTVINSVIGAGVTVGKGAVVRDSIVMKNTVIGPGCQIDRSIIAEEVTIGENCIFGVGEDVPNRVNPKVYSFGLVTVGENTVIPPGVQIGRNTAVSGKTESLDYPGGILASGETLIKAGER